MGFAGEVCGSKDKFPHFVRIQGLKFAEGFRADLLVENKVIVELKCVEKLNNAHKKQLLTTDIC